MIGFDQALGSHVQALRIQERRTALLAANLANADTPGYKARDIDFRAALAGASEGPLPLLRTARGHVDAPGEGLAGGPALYRIPQQASLDGNTVEVATEQAAFAENAVRYQATLRFLGGRFQGLMNALRGE